MASDVLQAASGLKNQLEGKVKAAKKRQATAETKLANVKKQIADAQTEATDAKADAETWSRKLAEFNAIGLAKGKRGPKAKAKAAKKPAKKKAKGKKATPKKASAKKKSGPAPLPRTASGEIDWRTKAGRAHKAKLQEAGKWPPGEKQTTKGKKGKKKGKVAKKKAAKKKAAAKPKAAPKKGKVAKKKAAPKAKAVSKKGSKKDGERPTLREAIIISMRGKEVFQAKDVFEALKERGWLPNTQNDPVAYLSFTLSKYKDSFERVKWGHYCVKGNAAGAKAPGKKGKKKGKSASPKGNGAEVAKPQAKAQTKAATAPKSTAKVDQDMADIGISPDGVADNPFEG